MCSKSRGGGLETFEGDVIHLDIPDDLSVALSDKLHLHLRKELKEEKEENSMYDEGSRTRSH